MAGKIINFKGGHFPKDLILMAVRWELAYPLSYRNIEELMDERDAELDHSTEMGCLLYTKTRRYIQKK